MKLLYERPGLPAFQIPEALIALYGGGLGFKLPRVIANFVASVDGVVALPIAAESGGVISQGSEADRLVMGLLRACAGSVLIGAGTFRKGEGFWDAESIYPKEASAFGELRRKLGLSPRPLLAVVSASGDLDLAHPALQQEALIVTTARGQARLGKARAKLLVQDTVDFASVLAALPAGVVLCEGGPTLVGQLIGEGLLDELFLTRSPYLFGRQKGDDRKALIDGLELHTSLELLSLRQDSSYLFLRYGISRTA
jgi:riboflavin biosynthesis pyrimidine reductase